MPHTHLPSIRSFSTQKKSTDDDFFSAEDFEEMGVEALDINGKKGALGIDSDSVPELSFEDYQQIKGMDLSQIGILFSKNRHARGLYHFSVIISYMRPGRNTTITRLQMKCAGGPASKPMNCGRPDWMS